MKKANLFWSFAFVFVFLAGIPLANAQSSVNVRVMDGGGQNNQYVLHLSPMSESVKQDIEVLKSQNNPMFESMEFKDESQGQLQVVLSTPDVRERELLIFFRDYLESTAQDRISRILEETGGTIEDLNNQENE